MIIQGMKNMDSAQNNQNKFDESAELQEKGTGLTGLSV
jgi:hypothetical protein